VHVYTRTLTAIPSLFVRYTDMRMAGEKQTLVPPFLIATALFSSVSQVNCTAVKEAWMQRLGGGQVKAEAATAATPVYDAVKDCVLYSTNLWYGSIRWELQPRLLPVTDGPMLYR
jgi:hypothetical protein